MPAPTSLDAPRDVRLLVVDDQELFRRGVALLLRDVAGFAVVGDAAGVGAVEAAVRTAPDVVLLEPRASGVGPETCREITSRLPGSRVLVLSGSDDEADLYAAMAHGAAGYLLKDATTTELTQAVRAVAGGQTMVSPALASTMVSGLRRAPAGVADPGARITARELEVLRLVAEGLHNREVADRLSISENTVKNHVRNLLDKLGLHSRVEAVMYAVRERLVDVS